MTLGFHLSLSISTLKVHQIFNNSLYLNIKQMYVKVFSVLFFFFFFVLNFFFPCLFISISIYILYLYLYNIKKVELYFILGKLH
jgi:hypothetical protein